MRYPYCLKIGLVILWLVFCSYGLWSQPSAGASATETIPDYNPPSTAQTPDHSSDNSKTLPLSLHESAPPSQHLNNPWEDLRNWINEGLSGLNASAESLTKLEHQLAALQVENAEQESLLRQSQELLISLKRSLAEARNDVAIAVDRMQDAEDYALWIDTQNIQLKLDAARLKKSALAGFAFGGVAFGVGIPFALEGIRSDNQTMVWSGVGTAAGTGLIWAAGRYVFKWW